MAENQHVQAPPPRGQGLGAPPPPWPQQPITLPRNDFGQLVRQGFGLGVGIWLALVVIGALLWVPLIVLALLGAMT